MLSIYTIILNYNNFKDTYECVDSLSHLEKANMFNHKIIIVDNASTDGSGAKLKHIFGDTVIYLQNDVNSGYAAGNNLGIKYALEKNADYICVLNNDTLVENDFYFECINYLNENEDVGFVSPVIENFNNNLVQSTGGDIVFRKGLVTVKNNGAVREKLSPIIESDYIGGACMVFKAELIKKIGFIPENYFLFFEETEWCWKAKTRGMRNLCLSSVYIKHKGSASIDTVTGLHAYLMERNRVVFLRRNSPNYIIYIRALIYLTIKYIKKGLIENRKYFKYLKYMNDGRRNIVDKHYPFVYIRN